mmetsp:Transcript_63308/g.185068  ORF Transcript_63308/g.185068 Transcript_63308/m.185068 type:complete len:218 (+) Transcript_63308:1350-2003(+)
MSLPAPKPLAWPARSRWKSCARLPQCSAKARSAPATPLVTKLTAHPRPEPSCAATAVASSSAPAPVAPAAEPRTQMHTASPSRRETRSSTPRQAERREGRPGSAKARAGKTWATTLLQTSVGMPRSSNMAPSRFMKSSCLRRPSAGPSTACCSPSTLRGSRVVQAPVLVKAMRLRPPEGSNKCCKVPTRLARGSTMARRTAPRPSSGELSSTRLPRP